MSVGDVALVTGATGFVGSHLARRLVREGFEVRALTHGGSKEKLADIASALSWFPLSSQGMRQATRGVTHFFNFAVVYDRREATDATIRAVNVELPQSILELLDVHGGSAACVLGDTFFRKFPADATPQPRYTSSKSLLADSLKESLARSSHRVGLLVIEHVYGPNDSLTKVFPRILRQLLEHVARVPLTSGQQRRDFVHVDDVVDAALTMARCLQPGLTTVGCGSGVGTPVRHVFERLKALSQSASALGFGDIAADSTILESIADTAWLRAHGWRPGTSLDVGLAELVSDMRGRLAPPVER